MACYIDKEGNRISSDQWKEYQKDDSYKFIQRYENDRFRISVSWHGKMSAQSPMDVPRDMWRMWMVEFENKIDNLETGEVHYNRDPELTKFLAFQPKANTYYKSLLVRYTECVADVVDLTDGSIEINDFIELGNRFTLSNEDDLEDYGISPDCVIKKDYEDMPEAGSW